MSDPLDPIRQAARDGALAYSIHAIEEMSEEGITFEEIHIVFGVARQPIKVVTVYRPDLRPEQWEADYRARRRTP